MQDMLMLHWLVLRILEHDEKEAPMKNLRLTYLILIALTIALAACSKDDDKVDGAADQAKSAMEMMKEAGSDAAKAAGDAADAAGDMAGDAVDAADGQ
jgi:hypothetical protein